MEKTRAVGAAKMGLVFRWALDTAQPSSLSQPSIRPGPAQGLHWPSRAHHFVRVSALPVPGRSLRRRTLLPSPSSTAAAAPPLAATPRLLRRGGPYRLPGVGSAPRVVAGKGDSHLPLSGLDGWLVMLAGFSLCRERPRVRPDLLVRRG